MQKSNKSNLLKNKRKEKVNMKKYKLFAFTIITAIISIITVNAREMTASELGQAAIDQYKSSGQDVGYIYVIGEYAFTSQYDIKTEDIMLAAKSINLEGKDPVKYEDGTNTLTEAYKKMVINTIRAKVGDDFNIEGWEITAAAVGSKDISDNTTLNIRYIDYVLQSEKSKADIKISSNIDNETYQTALENSFGIKKEDLSKLSEKLNYADGKLTGLMLRYEIQDQAGFVGKDKTGYYLPFVIEVPDLTENTVVTIKEDSTVTATYNNFDIKDTNENKVPGIVVLWSIPGENGRKITITIDLDGPNKNEYEPSTYTIDYTDLRFQEESKAELTTDKLPETDVESIKEKWGYQKEDGDTYTLSPVEGSIHKYELTGTIVRQTINNDVFPSDEMTGYYFLFNVGVDESYYKKATVTYPVKKSTGTETRTINDATGITILFSTSDDTKSKEIIIKVDLDGEGNEYFPVEYKIDLSKVILEKSSEFTVESLTGDKFNEESNWHDDDAGYSVKVDVDTKDKTLYHVSGVLPIVADEDWSIEGINPGEEELYYLGLLLKLTEQETSGVVKDKIDVKFFHDTIEEGKVLVSKDDFDGQKDLYILKALAKTSATKEFTITVDLDGDGETGKQYAPYTVTIDWSGLKLQEKTIEELDTNKASDADKKALGDYGYQSNANTGMKIDGTNGNYSVSGKLTQQVLNNDIFKNNTGYYFDFTFQLPKDVDLSKVEISRLTEANLAATDDQIKKTFKESEYDKESHTLTILYQFEEDPQCKNNGDNCKIYYRVDYDGDGKEYLPTLVTIDYSKLTFEKSSIFTVKGLETEEDYEFSDSGWLEKDGYSIKVSVDQENNHKYLVTGILPIFEDNEWQETHDPLESPENDYYLGLLLTLADEQIKDSDEESINVKFFHDDEDDKQFVKVFDSDFNSTKELYIMKYLVPSDETKEFTITVDLDGDAGEEYAPYTVTIDYSGVVFQNYSLSNVDFDVLKEVTNDSHEDKELKKYQFNSNTVNEVTTHTNAEQPDRPYKDGLSGKIKEQTLGDESGYETLSGYYVPVKISFPTDPELEEYKEKWTITLYDEKGNKLPTYEPTNEEYTQGWVMVLFKVKDTKESIKYEMDFDGDGDAFLPSSYEIKTENLEFQTENKISFEYFDETTGTIVTEEKVVYQGEPIPASLAPQFNDKNYAYHTLDYWYEEGKGSDSGFDFDHDSTDKNEDITLKAHWTIDIDTFLTHVVNDLANVESEITQDYSDIFKITKTDDTITFKVLDSTAKLRDLNGTSIPGTIAYILQRGEIKDITLFSGGKKVVFTKDGYTNGVQQVSLDPTGTALKEKVQAGAQALFKDILDDEENMTLNQMAVLDKNFTLEIGSLDETVKLKDDAKTTYTFKFETEVAPVKTEQELLDAIKNSKITHIDIVQSFSVASTVDVNRKVTISGTGSETLTASTTENSIFKITSSDVTIEKLTLGSSKTPITIANGGKLTASTLTFTGEQIESAIMVEDGGSFTGSEITYEGEKYSKPLVKTANASNAINLTNKQGEQAKQITVQEVKRYESTGEYKNQIGDELINKQGYAYKHYYNNPEVENNFIKISYSGDRTTTGYPISFIRWFDKEEPEKIEPPDDVQYLTSYSDSFADYTIEAWMQGGTISYQKGQVPQPKEDTYYGADLKATYKSGVTTVSDEESLKKEVSPDGTNRIIIVKDTIDLTSELDIKKSDITIIGVEEKGSKDYATIKGKIKVSADNVHFEKINIVGNSTENAENQNVITVNNTGFNTYQVNVSAEALLDGKKWNSLIHFTHANPKAIIYFGNFKGVNSEMIINFDQAIGHESKIVGNNFEGSNDTKEFININAIGANAEIDLRQQTATFVGANEYGIRINASTTKTNATITLGSFWSHSEGKVLEVGIDVKEGQYDASGFIFTAGAVFEDKIKIKYIKENGDVSDNNPYGENYNATLKVGDKVVSSPVSEPLTIAGLEHVGDAYSGTITQSEDGNFYIPITLTSNHLQPNVSTVKVTDPNGDVKTYTFQPSQESDIMLAMNSNTMELKLEAIKSSKIQDGKEKVYKLELDEDGAAANEREVQTYTIDYKNVKTEEEIILEAVQNTKDADSFTIQKDNYIKNLRDKFTYQIDNTNEIKYLEAGTEDNKIEQYSFPEKLVNPSSKKYIVVEKSKSISESGRPALNEWSYFNQFDSVSKGTHELELLKDMVGDSGIVDAIDTVTKKEDGGHTYIVKVSHEKLESWLNLQYIDGKIEEYEDEMEKHKADEETTITLEVTLDDSEEHIIALKTTTPFIIETTANTYENNSLDVQITNINETEIDEPEKVLGGTEEIQTFIQEGRDWWHKHTGSTSAGA